MSSNLKKFVLKFEIPKQKRRATELYDNDSPFRKNRIEENKTQYSRKIKHKKSMLDN